MHQAERARRTAPARRTRARSDLAGTAPRCQHREHKRACSEQRAPRRPRRAPAERDCSVLPASCHRSSPIGLPVVSFSATSVSAASRRRATSWLAARRRTRGSRRLRRDHPDPHTQPRPGDERLTRPRTVRGCGWAAAGILASDPRCSRPARRGRGARVDRRHFRRRQSPAQAPQPSPAAGPREVARRSPGSNAGEQRRSHPGTPPRAFAFASGVGSVLPYDAIPIRRARGYWSPTRASNRRALSGRRGRWSAPRHNARTGDRPRPRALTRALTRGTSASAARGRRSGTRRGARCRRGNRGASGVGDQGRA